MHVHEPHILVRAGARHMTACDHRSGDMAVAQTMQEAVARLGASR